MTSYSLAYGTGQLVYGPLSDRLGRIAVVRPRRSASASCTVLSALSPPPWQFVVARLLAGAFAGAVIPLTLVYIGDTVRVRRAPGRHRPRFSSSRRPGSRSPPPSAAWSLTLSRGGRCSWATAFSRWCRWGSCFRCRRAASARPGARARRRALRGFPHRSAGAPRLRLDLRGGLPLLGRGHLSRRLRHRRHGLDQLQIGLLIALFGVGTMVGGSLMAPFRRRLSENALAGTGGLLMGPPLFVLIPRWPWPAFAASMLMLGLGFVGLHSTLQLRGTEISSTARGKAFSLFRLQPLHRHRRRHGGAGPARGRGLDARCSPSRARARPRRGRRRRRAGDAGERRDARGARGPPPHVRAAGARPDRRRPPALPRDAGGRPHAVPPQLRDAGAPSPPADGPRGSARAAGCWSPPITRAAASSCSAAPSPSSPTTSPQARRARGDFVNRQGLLRRPRAAPARRGRELLSGARRADRALQPEHRHPLLRQGPGAGLALRRRAHPRAAGGRRLGLRQALPRQGPRAGGRAPGPARHRLRLERDARGAPAAVPRRDRGGSGLHHDLAPALPAPRSRARTCPRRSRG